MLKKLCDISGFNASLGHGFRGSVASSLEQGQANCLVAQPKNLHDGELESTLDEAHIPKIKPNSKALLSEGDILLSNRGVFKAAVYRGVDSSSLMSGITESKTVIPSPLISNSLNDSNDGAALPIIAASSLYIIRVSSDAVLPDYLALWFNSALGQTRLDSLHIGAVIKNITKSALQDLEIEIPSLAAQQDAVHLSWLSKQAQSLYTRQAQLKAQNAQAAITQLMQSH